MMTAIKHPSNLVFPYKGIPSTRLGPLNPYLVITWFTRKHQATFPKELGASP